FPHVERTPSLHGVEGLGRLDAEAVLGNRCLAHGVSPCCPGTVAGRRTSRAALARSMMAARRRPGPRRCMWKRMPAAVTTMVYGAAMRKRMLQLMARLVGSFGPNEAAHMAHDCASARDAVPSSKRAVAARLRRTRVMI